MAIRCLSYFILITFVKCRGSFFFINLLEAVYNSIIFRVKKRLIYEPDFDDFERLHNKDLNPTGNASRKKIFKSINDLAHFFF